MIERVRKAILENGLIAPGETVIAGISGGADSTALVLALKALEGSMGFHIAAAHFNHCIRGESADKDEAFVRGLCAENSIPLFCERADVPKFAAENRLSVETAGRVLRYGFLEKVRRCRGAAVIATAHHMEDNAESVLLHLARGSGLKGLCGMDYKRGNIIHPLLGIRKREIESFLAAQNAAYCIDDTNFIAEGSRNIIRLNLIPLLEKELKTDVVCAVNRCAALLREDEAYLAEASEKALDEAKTIAGYDRKKLAALPRPLLTRAIRLALLRAGVMTDTEKIHIESIVKLLSAQSGALCQIPHAEARISFESIIFSPVGGKCFKMNESAAKPDENAVVAGENVPEAGKGAAKSGKNREADGLKAKAAESGSAETVLCESAEDMRKAEFPFGSLETETALPPRMISHDGNIACMDIEKLQFPLIVRSRISGDRFRPANSFAEKKLKDYFIERKVDSAKRGDIPLVISGGRIVFVAGFGISDDVKVTSETKKILRIIFRKNNIKTNEETVL